MKKSPIIFGTSANGPRSFFFAFLFVTVVSLGAVPSSNSTNSGIVEILLKAGDWSRAIRKLRDADIDIAAVDRHESLITIVVTRDEVSKIRRLSGEYFYELLSITEVTGQIVDPEYKNPAEIEVILKDYAEKFPRLSRLVKVGTSLENRPIWAMRITTDPQGDRPTKPTVLFNGMHHAREVMSPEVPLDIIDQLLTQYDRDRDIKSWVDNYEIWVLPMLNVDGSNKVWNGMTMWRKNTRNGHGVDLNRNYPYAWGSCNGSSGSTFSQTYRGTAPASEPEAQTLMNLVAAIRPTFDISFHSAAEMVLYPYGCSGQRTPSDELLKVLGADLAKGLPRDTEPSRTYLPGLAWEILYAVDGDDISWMYNTHGVLPFVIEINSSSSGGFHPRYAQWRDSTVEKLRYAWKYLLTRMGQGQIRGKISGKLEPETSIQVEQMVNGKVTGLESYRPKSDGSFLIITNPGKFRVTQIVSGKKFEPKTVQVQNSPVDLNL